MSRRPRAELRESMRQIANRERSAADEIASMFDGCDDSLHPFMPVGDHQQFQDWHDFVDRVCRPLVECDDEESEQIAMRLYRQANPHFIATCLYLAAQAEPLTFERNP